GGGEGAQAAVGTLAQAAEGGIHDWRDAALGVRSAPAVRDAVRGHVRLPAPGARHAGKGTGRRPRPSPGQPAGRTSGPYACRAGSRAVLGRSRPSDTTCSVTASGTAVVGTRASGSKSRGSAGGGAR